MSRQLLLLEFNEISFDNLAFYRQRGLLPNLNALIERHGYATTLSEQRYEELEPWIQWVTAHTGQSYAEHRVFRLGDILNKENLVQIWEELEAHGLRVGAISPMNARNALRNPAFFVPDPWTSTRVSARPRLSRLYSAIAQAVNDNAQARITPRSAWNLLNGLVHYARPENYASYVKLVAGSRAHPWRRAMVLDLLLSDVFIREVEASGVNFASLFLNAGAHIQHHYLFSAECYTGEHRNPDWYVKPGLDPVREVYELYDRILGSVLKTFPSARIMIATGLHQDPHDEVTFYWRLRNHAAFLRKIGVPFASVEPRMSRDFLLKCRSAEEAAVAERRLASAVAEDGLPLFEVDNRGSDLFVMLVYPRNISAGFTWSIGEQRYSGLANDVAFVALKNGKHNGVGYFIDTGTRFGESPATFELKQIPDFIRAAFGLKAHSLRESVREDRGLQFAG